MEKVKIKDIKTGAIIEVAKELASDYIATGRYHTIEEKKLDTKSLFKDNKKENENMK